MTMTAKEKLMAKATQAADDAIGKTMSVRKRHAKPGVSGIVVRGTIEACVVSRLKRNTSSAMAEFGVLVRGEWFYVTELPK